jgi:4-oxalocrotonate tautomerase
MPVINLQVTKGLNRDQKRKIIKEFTQTLVTVACKRPEHIHILINELNEQDWGFNGMLTDEWKSSSKTDAD